MKSDLPDNVRNAVSVVLEAEEVGIEMAEVVDSWGPFTPGSATHRQLSWLCFFAVRRALPCWDLYSDGQHPRHCLETVRRYLTERLPPEQLEPCEVEVEPTYRGRVIIDCTTADTGFIAQAVAALARFCHRGKAQDAVDALECAQGALSESPLRQLERFNTWFVEVAITAAASCRELTTDEQIAFRSYDPEVIARVNERGGMKPHTA